jgi:hypothetical protein
MTLEESIAPFRALEANDDAIPVLGDDKAMRVLVAWTHVDNEWAAPELPRPRILPGRMSALWDWIVAGWDVESMVQRVSRTSGVPADIVHSKLEILIGNRLIYPDGSMAKGAKAALNVIARRKLGIKQIPQRPAAQPAPKKDDDRDN